MAVSADVYKSIASSLLLQPGSNYSTVRYLSCAVISVNDLRYRYRMYFNCHSNYTIFKDYTATKFVIFDRIHPESWDVRDIYTVSRAL